TLKNREIPDFLAESDVNFKLYFPSSIIEYKNDEFLDVVHKGLPNMKTDFY
ncbi:24530_t:CDS:1, partial [Racocetra persica]